MNLLDILGYHSLAVDIRLGSKPGINIGLMPSISVCYELEALGETNRMTWLP